ncbi:hypothetical protein BH10BAC5_BH10BAC5_21830 [soil metagenome]
MKSYFLLLILIFFSPSVSDAQYSLTGVFTNTTFNKPLEMVPANDGSDRLFIVGQRGVIYIVNPLLPATPGKIFLDISDRVSPTGLEPGLLGLAFHPQFAVNRYFYVYYTKDTPARSFIARYQVSASNPDSAVKESELIIFTNTLTSASHYGGKIDFGRDKFLYIALGMGNGQNDPSNNSQNLTNVMGKVLRINVDSASGGNNYSIPSTNPFIDSTSTVRKEIYAWGFRNPWKFNFDSTGAMWLADVGQNLYEEIDIVTKGKNYGWRIMEGFNCFNPTVCDTTGLAKPVFVYQHNTAGGTSITGGYVSYSPNLPLLKNRYIFGDYGNGKIWALSMGTSPVTSELLIDSPYQISSFGTDKYKNIYICSIGDSKIYKLVDLGVRIINVNESREYVISKNYPNPFNPSTIIQFNVPERAFVILKVYNNLGKEIKTLANESMAEGTKQLQFSADNIPSGVYYYKIEMAGSNSDFKFNYTGKMLLVK